MNRISTPKALLVLTLFGALSSTVSAQQASDDGEERTLTTADGWAIPINYYESSAGKDSPVVIMFPGVEGKADSRTRKTWTCLLYTSPSPRDLSTSRMPSSA